MATRPTIKPHLVGTGANQVTLWGGTSLLQVFFPSVTPNAVEIPELVDYQRKGGKVRKYPGHAGYNRRATVVSRYDKSPAKFGGAKPGLPFVAARLTAQGDLIKTSKRTFRLVGSWADLCEWAKDAAVTSVVLYSPSGSPFIIPVAD
jgi:hypothetical protein